MAKKYDPDKVNAAIAESLARAAEHQRIAEWLDERADTERREQYDYENRAARQRELLDVEAD